MWENCSFDPRGWGSRSKAILVMLKKWSDLTIIKLLPLSVGGFLNSLVLLVNLVDVFLLTRSIYLVIKFGVVVVLECVVVVTVIVVVVVLWITVSFVTGDVFFNNCGVIFVVVAYVVNFIVVLVADNLNEDIVIVVVIGFVVAFVFENV